MHDFPYWVTGHLHKSKFFPTLRGKQDFQDGKRIPNCLNRH